MTVAVQQPQREQEKDPLDIIQQALGIATNIYGVALERDKANALIEQNRLKGAEEMRARELADQDRQMNIDRDFAEVKPGTEGALKLPQRQGLFLPRSEIARREKVGLEKLKITADEKKEKEAKAPTADDKTYALHGKAMEAANNILLPLESDPELNASGFKTSVQKSSLFPEIFKPEKLKSYEQAQRAFIQAVLRKQSGATIAPSEFEEKKKEYFPQAGDPPDVIAQKQMARQLAVDQFKASSGKAWDDSKSYAITKSEKTNSQPGTAQAAVSTFPRKVVNPKTNQSAIVSSEDELKEAMEAGFK